MVCSSAAIRFVFLFATSSALLVARAGAPDLNQDGRVDGRDLLRFPAQWQQAERGADSTGDGKVDGEDLLDLVRQWKSAQPTNPHATGRAVGLRAKSLVGDQVLWSPELEIEIVAPGQGRLLSAAQPVARALGALPPPAELEALIGQQIATLGRGAGPAQGPQEMNFGHPTDRIPCIGGWSFWLGWSASFSDSYLPESETYSWMVYFAADGVYVALQSAESNYSAVDVFMGYSYSFGMMTPPGGTVLTRSYVSSLMGVSISYNFPMPLAPYGPVPSVAFSIGPTFFRVGSAHSLERAIQFNAAFSVSFELMPIPLPLPISVSLDFKSNMDAGFYPIVAWNLNDNAPGTPIDKVAEELDLLAALPGNSYIEANVAQLAGALKPLFNDLRTPPATSEPDWPGDPGDDDDGTITDPPPKPGDYFRHFLISATDTIDPASVTYSVRNQMVQVEQWLATGDTGNLPQALRGALAVHPLRMNDRLKAVHAGTQAAFEVGYKHGYDAAVREGRRDPNQVYADCVIDLAVPVNQSCALVVEAAELVALLPGSQAADFEGVDVEFMTPPETYLATQQTSAWVTLENGRAVYSFTPHSAGRVLVPVKVPRTAVTNDLTLYLCPRAIEVQSEAPAATVLQASPQALRGEPTVISTGLTDANNSPVFAESVVRLYDYRDYLIAGPLPAADGMLRLPVTLQPSIPEIRRFVTSLIGPSEEEARTGYALTGRGFSMDADVLFDGVSINNMTDWLWQVTDSREILFLPPDDNALFTEPVEVQVVNPQGIASAVWQYVP